MNARAFARTYWLESKFDFPKIAGGARLELAQLAGLVPLLLAGTLPFSAMGLALQLRRGR